MSAGTIVFDSRNGGMVVVRHDDGYTLVEMLGDEGALVMCDIVSETGMPWVASQSTHRAIATRRYFQGTWASPEPPIRMLRGGR